jgi:hypothetical protein
VRSVNPLEKNPLTWRIVIHNPFDNQTYVLAVSDTESVIRKHWKSLLDELIPHIYALKDSPELVIEDDDFVFIEKENSVPIENPRTKYNYSTFEEEVILYLFGKVSSLAQLEEGFFNLNIKNSHSSR